MSSIFASLRVKTLLMIFISLSILILSFTFYYYSQNKQREYFEYAFNETTEAILNYLYLGLEYGLKDDDYEMIQNVLDWVKNESKVSFVVLIDADKSIIASHPTNMDVDINKLDYLCNHSGFEDSVVVKTKKFATAFGKSTFYIGFTTRHIHEQEQAQFVSASKQTLVILVLGIFAAYLISRQITKPLHNLSKTASVIADGDMERRANINSGGLEIRELALAFNSMIQKIIDSQEALFSEMAKYNASLDAQNQNLVKANDALQNEIVAREKIQNELKNSENLMRNIIETAPAAIMYLDPDFQILLLNRLGASMMNMETEDILGQNFLDMIPADVNQKITDKLRNIADINVIDSFECDISFPERQFHSYTALSPHYSDDGEMLGVVVVNLDITKIKEAEIALRESEERFRLLTENSADHIMEVDTQKVVYANKTYWEQFGVEPSSVADWDPYSGIHPDDVPMLRDTIWKSFSNEESVNAVFRFCPKDDQKWRWIETKGNYYKTAAGKTHSVFINRDITESKEAEQALRESELKFRALSESAKDAIIILDNNGKAAFWNKSASRLFGYSEEEVQHSLLHQLIMPESYSEKFSDGFQKFRQSGEGTVIGKTLELEAIKKSGEKFPIELSISAVMIKGKWNAIGIGRDISERKNMEFELKRAIKDAESANRAKSEFLANMSHEIRTPMNAILGFSQLLAGKIENPQYKSYVDAITSSGKSLLSLINDILDLSKIEAGKLELEYEAVNPYTIFKEIQGFFSYKIREKGLEFRTQIDPGLPKGLILDEIRLRQILVNIVGNALKFTETGYISLAVIKEFSADDDSKLHLTFSVEDTGIGIKDQDRQRIFEAFKQQSGQSTRKFGGTGLGLAITKRLVEMMGGKIHLESKYGEGSKFIVTLDNIPVAATTGEIDNREETLMNEIKFTDTKILLVDDIEINRRLIKEYFENSEVEIYEASDGRQAVEQTQTIIPDIILMDMKMPVMDGYEAVKLIRKTAGIDTIPIIALTASAMKGDEIMIKKIGCNGYLSKPVDKFALLREMASHIPDKVIKDDSDSVISKIEQDVTDFVFRDNPDFINNADAIIAELETDYLPQSKKLKNTLIIGKVKEFADSLKQFAEMNNIKPIANYAAGLEGLTNSFDMTNIRKSLDYFPEVIETIRKLKP